MSTRNKITAGRKQSRKKKAFTYQDRPLVPTVDQTIDALINDEYLFLPGLLKNACIIAHIISKTGLDYKQFLYDKRYIYTSNRLQRIYKRNSQYGATIMQAWNFKRPGFLLYSKRYVQVKGIREYKDTWSREEIMRQLTDGTIIRISSEIMMSDYECYRVRGSEKDFQLEWILNLPVYDESEHISKAVLPVFQQNIIKFGIDSFKNTYGLPSWYVALQNVAEIVPIRPLGLIGVEERFLSEIRCILISSIKNAKEYKPWDDNEMLYGVKKYCLHIAFNSPKNDTKLITNFKRHNLYIIEESSFHNIQLRTNNMIFHITVKGNRFVSDNRKKKMVYEGVFKEDGNQLFFDLLFKGQVNNVVDWYSKDLEVGNKYQIWYDSESSGFRLQDLLSIKTSLDEETSVNRKRMYIVGRKGCMKTTFKKTFKLYGPKDVVIIDSDNFGQWYSWVCANRKGDFSFTEENKDIPSAIEIKASKIFGSDYLGYGRRMWNNGRQNFNHEFLSILKDETKGIEKWQDELEESLDPNVKMVIYFTHTSVEHREMRIPSSTPTLRSFINSISILRSRDRSNGRDSRPFQEQLDRYYIDFIPKISNFIDYKDIFLLFDCDIEF